MKTMESPEQKEALKAETAALGAHRRKTEEALVACRERGPAIEHELAEAHVAGDVKAIARLTEELAAHPARTRAAEIATKAVTEAHERKSAEVAAIDRAERLVEYRRLFEASRTSISEGAVALGEAREALGRRIKKYEALCAEGERIARLLDGMGEHAPRAKGFHAVLDEHLTEVRRSGRCGEVLSVPVPIVND